MEITWQDGLFIAEGELDGAYTHDAVVELPSRRFAVGIIGDRAGGAPLHSKVLTVQIDGGTVHEWTADVSNLESQTNSRTEDGMTFAAPSAGSHTIKVRVKNSDTAMRGIMIRVADPYSGIVEDQGTSTHCRPTACLYGGRLYRVHAQMYDGDRYLSIDNAPWGKLFDGLSADINERYHDGIAVCANSYGVGFFAIGHNHEYLRFRYAKDGDMANLTPVQYFGTAGDSLTYAHVVALDDDDFMVLVRMATYGLNVIRITSEDWSVPDTPGHTEDIIGCWTGKTMYPHAFQHGHGSGGRECVCALWNAHKIDWGKAIGGAVFDVTNNRWYNIKGDECSGSAALGTKVTPRFDSGRHAALVHHSTPGLKIFGYTGTGQRYTTAALFDPREWADPSGTARVGVLYPYVEQDYPTVGGMNSYAEDVGGDPDPDGAVVKWLSVTYPGGAYTRNFLSGDADPGLASNYYRFSAAFRWLDDDPDTGVAYCLITDRGNRIEQTRWSEDYDPYYDWGTGANLLLYKITDPVSAAPTWSLERTISVPGGYTAMNITKIAGCKHRFTVQCATNEAVEVHRQMLTVDYRVLAYYNIYRGIGGIEEIDWDTPVAYLHCVQGNVTFGQNLLAGRRYVYAARAVSSAGLEEHNTHVITFVEVDSQGGLMPAPLARSTDVTVDVYQTFLLIGLSYHAPVGFADADGFDVLSDNGTGQLNLDNPVATIDVSENERFDFEVAIDRPESPVLLAVRARKNGLIGPLSEVRFVAAVSAPAPAQIL